MCGGLAFGYDLGVVAGAECYIQSDLGLSDNEVTAVVTTAKIGAVIGVVVGAALFDLAGRRRALAWTGGFYARRVHAESPHRPDQ